MNDHAMKPRRTMHRGIEMRSRLEANWAAALDREGIAWVYEPLAFSSKSGQYLPDFFIEPLNLYLEVKPVDEVLGNYQHGWLTRMEIIWESDPTAALMLVAGPPDFHQGYIIGDNERREWWETQHALTLLSILCGRLCAA